VSLRILSRWRVETDVPERADGARGSSRAVRREWTRGVIDRWFGSEHYFETDRYQWVERLPGLCGVLRTCGVPKLTHRL
jgi:hypothetical protein